MRLPNKFIIVNNMIDNRTYTRGEVFTFVSYTPAQETLDRYQYQVQDGSICKLGALDLEYFAKEKIIIVTEWHKSEFVEN